MRILHINIILLFILNSTKLFAQENDSIVSSFNINNKNYCGISFGNSFPGQIEIDSFNTNNEVYNFDKQEHKNSVYRFRAHLFNLKAKYYVFTIDDIVHLVNIELDGIDSIQIIKVIELISPTLSLQDFKKTEFNVGYYKLKFTNCPALSWIEFNPNRKLLKIQISDNFYCRNIEF